MRYILDERYCLRGWEKLPTGLLDRARRTADFFPKDLYLLLMRCDGAHDLDESALSEEERGFLEKVREDRIIRPARVLEYLAPEQAYKAYPAVYKQHAQWSVTGACNLKCRHCFMSAPHAKHGSPTHEQILNVADQLAECGVCTVSLTGGEPLIRDDFPEIIDALCERDIGLTTIYTNGWLVDEAFLDALDARRVHPGFQLSFDGVGRHDFLRGVPGAEKKTIRALKLLREREYAVSVSMCIHKKNKDVLRESVKLLAGLGVFSVKCGSMMELGEWASPEVRDLQLSRQEELELFEKYIPEYFEDDAPVSIMMADTLTYTPGDPEWRIYDVRRISEEEEAAPSCGVITRNFFIGAEGMVAPCMGMCDCGYASNFQNLFETPLREILGGEAFTKLCTTSVGEIRDHNPKCRACAYVDRCTGGCRNSVLLRGDDYYGIDEDVCYFFENGWEERIRKAAEPAFAAYLKRNPAKARPERGARLFTETEPDCL